MQINEDNFTDEHSVQLMRYYIETHYIDLQKGAKSITPLWEELLSETILSLLSAKRFPLDIFKRNKEFVYIWVSMKHKLYSKLINFNDKFSFIGYDDIKSKYEINSEEYTNQIEDEDEPYDFYLEYNYNKIYEFIKSSMNKKEIPFYNAVCFILYYMPEYAKEFINITDEQLKPLKINPTYRAIQKITNINFQSIRLTVLKTLTYVKENLEIIKEPVYKLN